MKRFLPIILLCAGVLVCILALNMNFFNIDIRLSLKKYHEYTVGDREFEFYGSFGKIYKITGNLAPAVITYLYKDHERW